MRNDEGRKEEGRELMRRKWGREGENENGGEWEGEGLKEKKRRKEKIEERSTR